jgi:hydrogenase 3 maturation protease
MGIGNPLRRDDFVGMKIVKRLKRTLPNVRIIEAGEVPESYLSLVEEAHPSHILMIDAAEMGVHPGLVRLVSPRRIAGLSLSTHTLPLSVVSEYLAKNTQAKIALLAIQPKILDYGEGLSQELSTVARRLPGLIVRAVKVCGKEATSPARRKQVQKRLAR